MEYTITLQEGMTKRIVWEVPGFHVETGDIPANAIPVKTFVVKSGKAFRVGIKWKNPGVPGSEMKMVFETTELAALREKYPHLLKLKGKVFLR